ncbi:plasmid pRiA4b ORF-3 family protein [Thermoanaerobacterium thermosaccharolyticum]|uniref:plasmid pRiA4b ORF-3 family protein n=1 Tax=Thermoanaerobacterium thermosaccharolyticum TaxID=1517 RepID=UPI003DA8828A
MKILQLKITLKDVKPPVWRRVLVKDDITFYKLHKIIQYTMGWFEVHLYEFRLGNMIIGEKSDEFDIFSMGKIKSARRVKLNSMNFVPKDKFRYVYDFGDDWIHDIVVEKVLEPEEGIKYPICIGGKRCCPPEDVGGPWGYMNFLEAIRDPKHPEHESMLEWVGGSFDPEEFSVEEVNEGLKFIK